MKILEVAYGLASGGAERLVVDLCNELARTEDVTLLLLKDVDHFYLPQVSPRVKVVEAHWQVGFRPRYMTDAVRLIKNIHPDVVHFHSQARYSLILANILLRSRYRFFMTLHNDVEKNYAHGISGLQVRLCGHLGRCRFITISDTNHRQFSHIHPRLRQKLITNGRALPLLSGKLEEVRTEIETYKTCGTTPVFINVARCAPVKNHRMLVGCFNKMHEEGTDFTLLIIGNNFDSEEGCRLQKEACRNIHFLGEKQNVYDYLASADAFCLSSTYEGMPMSIIEALLSGLPVISTPTCGAVDVIRSGQNGIISDDFDQDGFLNAIHRFLKEKQLISATAKKEAGNSPLSIKNCAEQHLLWFNNAESTCS